MSVYLTGIVPNGSGRTVTATREVWEINIYQQFFNYVVLELAELFADLFCLVCQQNHYTESGLIKCLRFHKKDTVDFYLNCLEASQ